MKDQILQGAPGIAKYTGIDERKIRHLMDKHGLPHRRHGRAIFALASEVERYFSSQV